MSRRGVSRPVRVRSGGSPRVEGFSFAGGHCGIKERDADLALLVSDRPAAAAGVFTRSTVVGAPVVLSKRHLRSGRARAVVVNSGISNVAMGAQGDRDAAEMAALTAEQLGCAPRDVVVASTGVIGEPLPMSRLRRGIPALHAALAPTALGDAARAIMTTDTVAKLRHTRVEIAGKPVSIAGIAKGSGMIEPNMATMLAYVVTDAAVAPPFLRTLWKANCQETFNRVTVDGETSTSDSAVILANGAAEARALTGPRSRGAAAFRDALLAVTTGLAQDLARDGEGATKLVTVVVRGARSHADAERAGRRIANSLLVKTAIFGRDPNWGRILQTVGAGRVRLDLAKTVVRLCGVPVFRAGASTGPAARKRAGARHARPEIEIEVDLGVGRGEARFWTCDLSHDYVRINAEYTT